MIGRLRGQVLSEEPGGSVVLDVNGVGYDLMTPLGTVARATATAGDGGLELHVHTHVRDDAIELFGFASDAERRAFRLMIGVPNVGPKTALNALSALPLEELTHAVQEGDVARLSRVPGIGKKTAERIVLELRGKVSVAGAAAAAEPPGAGAEGSRARLVAALTNMGYRAAEAERAVRSLDDRIDRESLADLLRQALARLTP
jgi:Holliday junction DNA helicase RuvA